MPAGQNRTAVGGCEANSHLNKVSPTELFLLSGGESVRKMSLERSWSPTAVQMFSQGLGSSLLASTRRSLDHSGICSTVLEVLSPSLGSCQLPQASGNNFCCQESISYFGSISERWLARMIDASHHPYKLSLQLRHQQAQGCVPSSKSPGQLCTLSGTQPK